MIRQTFFAAALFSMALLVSRPRPALAQEAQMLVKSRDALNKRVGLPFRARLEFLPVDELPVDELKRLEGTYVGGSLYIAQVFRAAVSANNPDVYVVQARVVGLREHGEGQKVKAILGGTPLMVWFQNFGVLKEGVGPIKDYHTFTMVKEGQAPWWLYLSLAAAALAVLVAGLWWWRRRGSKEEENQQQQRQRWEQEIIKPLERQELEEMFRRRREILTLFSEQSDVWHEAFKVIDRHQYKPQWSAQEQAELERVISRLRHNLHSRPQDHGAESHGIQ